MSEVKNPLPKELDAKKASAASVGETSRAKFSQHETIRSLRDVIGVPLPPSDWEGYKDPKYKVQEVMKKREDDTIKRHLNRNLGPPPKELDTKKVPKTSAARDEDSAL